MITIIIVIMMIMMIIMITMIAMIQTILITTIELYVYPKDLEQGAGDDHHLERRSGSVKLCYLISLDRLAVILAA